MGGRVWDVFVVVFGINRILTRRLLAHHEDHVGIEVILVHGDLLSWLPGLLADLGGVVLPVIKLGSWLGIVVVVPLIWLVIAH